MPTCVFVTLGVKELNTKISVKVKSLNSFEYNLFLHENCVWKIEYTLVNNGEHAIRKLLIVLLINESYIFVVFISVVQLIAVQFRSFKFTLSSLESFKCCFEDFEDRSCLLCLLYKCLFLYQSCFILLNFLHSLYTSFCWDYILVF